MKKHEDKFKADASRELVYIEFKEEASKADEDALKAFQLVSKLENISPSLEPSHAFAEAIRLAPKLKSSDVIIVNSCGDSLKDKDIIKKRLGTYKR